MTSYAGIGSRNITEQERNDLHHLGRTLGKLGITLRSGGADGADTAFEKGCIEVEGTKEIYLPSERFNGRNASQQGYGNFQKAPGFEKAMETVDRFHPAPQYLKPFPRLLMGRNACQIWGQDMLDPVAFVICCADPQGDSVKGGTGQAVRIANDAGIPVFNLRVLTYEQVLEEIQAFI